MIIYDQINRRWNCIFENIDKERKQHVEVQKNSRNGKAQNVPGYKEKFRDYDRKQSKYASINMKQLEETTKNCVNTNN